MDDLGGVALKVVDLLSKRLLSGSVEVILSGELGAGKTTFAEMVIRGLGYTGEDFVSPTYVLQRIYRVSEGLMVEHWDLYRVRELPVELDFLPEVGVLRLIEWGERFMLPEEVDLVVRIDRGDRLSRVTISGATLF
ncbi:MAG TPA: tRNA (adenosine(37)-N6)-threonylcarbamoyltransferase complex ATPase subunit type 1 TsaE [Oligoflexia bacterium]|nr:tRNA (adenosine(37)-N6)-threonylcarbamoyltransferase complex ATPase subunit type 1 TsaE [Oligoflexia bacterium]